MVCWNPVVPTKFLNIYIGLCEGVMRATISHPFLPYTSLSGAILACQRFMIGH